VTSRPLLRFSVAQLEEQFSVSKADAKTLKALEAELQCRQAPRAVSLLTEVQAVLHGMEAIANPAAVPIPTLTPPARQADLWGDQSSPAPRTSFVPAMTQPAPPRPAPVSAGAPIVHVPTLRPAASRALDASSVMSADDAYKVLKATPSSTWESIEQTRRQLVQQAHPERIAVLSPERQVQAQAEAKRVNLAYAIVRQSKDVGL